MKRSLVESIDQLWVQLESLKQDVVEQERLAKESSWTLVWFAVVRRN